MGIVVRIVKGYIIGGSLLPSLGWLLWLSNYHHHPGGALLLNLHLAGAAAGILVSLINTEWRSGDRHRDEWLAAALNAVPLPVPLGYLYLGERMRLIGSFITRTILVVIGSLILLASIFGAAGPGVEALMLTVLGTLLLTVALNTWGAYRLAASHNRDFGTETSHRPTLIGAIAGAGISFAAVAGQAFFGGSASATEVLAVFGLPALTFGAGAGAFTANALGRMGALGTVGAFAGFVYVLSPGLPAHGVPWSGMWAQLLVYSALGAVLAVTAAWFFRKATRGVFAGSTS